MGILDDKVAIVTGGGRGLGRAHCLALAEAGATVVVNDLGSGIHGEQTGDSPADEVVAEITKLGGRAVANHSSVTDWAATETMVADTVAEFGRLDIVVNNAGIVRDRMLFSMTEAEFDTVIAVHLKGTFALTRHACAYWREASKRGEPVSGRVINTTSGTGLFGNQGQSNYGAAKAGIAGLTVLTALEMRRYGVTANAISPIAATRMTDGLAVGESLQAVEGFDPRDPANASGVVVYLASDSAAWLTGQVLRIEGNRLNRLQGWTVAAVHPSQSGQALTYDELVDAVPQLYGAVPRGPGDGRRPVKGHDAAALVLRATLGPMLFAHGWNKVAGPGGLKGTTGWFEALGLKPAEVHARMAAGTEMAAGVGIALGAANPLPAAAAVGLMAVAARTDHRGKGFFVFKGGWEYAGVVGGAAVALAALGNGRYSLDGLLRRQRAGTRHALLAAGIGTASAAALLALCYRPQQKPDETDQ